MKKNSRKPISFVSGRATQPTFSSSFPTFLWETDMCRRLHIYLLRFVCFWFFFRLGKILVPWLENFWVMLCSSAFWRRGNLSFDPRTRPLFVALHRILRNIFKSSIYLSDRGTKPSFKARVFFAFPAPPTLPLPPQKNREDAAEEQPTMWLFFFWGGGGEKEKQMGWVLFGWHKKTASIFWVCRR